MTSGGLVAPRFVDVTSRSRRKRHQMQVDPTWRPGQDDPFGHVLLCDSTARAYTQTEVDRLRPTGPFLRRIVELDRCRRCQLARTSLEASYDRTVTAMDDHHM